MFCCGRSSSAVNSHTQTGAPAPDQHVQDPQAVPVGDRAQHPLELDRLPIAERRAGHRRATPDRKAIHKEIFVDQAAMQAVFSSARAPGLWKICAQPRGRSTTRAHTFVLDDDQSRNRADPEPLEEFRVPIGVDAPHLERLMVSAALQHLRQEALCPPRAARGGRIEEEQLRSIRCRTAREVATAELVAASKDLLGSCISESRVRSSAALGLIPHPATSSAPEASSLPCRRARSYPLRRSVQTGTPSPASSLSTTT